MKQTILLLLMLVAGAFAYCLPHDAGSITLADCEDYVVEENYIDAGCCYKSLEVWDKCALYLLKGARHSEILWDLNEGSYAEGGKAKAFYNIEYYETTGLGSDTGVCLYYNDDSILTEQIDEYHDWIVLYGFPEKSEPPFDMATLINTFDNKIFPPEATPTPVPSLLATPVPTTVPTATPEPEQDNTGVLIIIVVIIIAVIAYFMFMKKKPSEPEPVYPESMEKPVEPKKSGFIYKAAEKAKKEHEEEHKEKKEEKKEHKKRKKAHKKK